MSTLHPAIAAPTALLSRAAATAPGRVALVAGGLAATAAILNTRVALLAGVLAYLGLPRGARVALALDGDPRQLEASLGVLRAGLTVLRLDAAIPAVEALHLLRRQEARVLIATPAAIQRLRAAAPAAPRGLSLIAAGRGLGTAPGAFDYEQALETAEASFLDAAGLPQDAALIEAVSIDGHTQLSRTTHRALADAVASRAARLVGSLRLTQRGEADLVTLLAALASGTTLLLAGVEDAPAPAAALRLTAAA